jgi:hypothetical protein
MNVQPANRFSIKIANHWVWLRAVATMLGSTHTIIPHEAEENDSTGRDGSGHRAPTCVVTRPMVVRHIDLDRSHGVDHLDIEWIWTRSGQRASQPAECQCLHPGFVVTYSAPGWSRGRGSLAEPGCPPGTYSDFVIRLLRYLDEEQFEASPRFLGLDGDGRQVLSFMEGYVAPDLDVRRWSAEEIAAAFLLLRRFHDLMAGSQLADGEETVCHNDFTPCNVVYSSRSHCHDRLGVRCSGHPDARPWTRGMAMGERRPSRSTHL